MAAGWQHRDDDLGGPERSSQILAGTAATGGELLDTGGHQIMAAYLAAGFHQVQRHRQTHVAEADKNDFATHIRIS